jgi:hypothetical protein
MSENENNKKTNTANTNSNIEGPTMLWGMLKGKEVITNDGEKLGEIKEVTQNSILVEKGLIKKERLWIPKFITDAFDGKVLWLLVSEDEINKRYNYKDNEPTTDLYLKDFESFKNSPTAKDYSTNNPDIETKIRVIENYKNIRDL